MSAPHEPAPQHTAHQAATLALELLGGVKGLSSFAIRDGRGLGRTCRLMNARLSVSEYRVCGSSHVALTMKPLESKTTLYELHASCRCDADESPTSGTIRGRERSWVTGDRWPESSLPGMPTWAARGLLRAAAAQPRWRPLGPG